ncbi:MAG TPA: hypothetical protein VFV81_04070 [Verrucomicrobiae bacterium]|nr:hypothetical protein [Verrucomicrobiae bacterium]
MKRILMICFVVAAWPAARAASTNDLSASAVAGGDSRSGLFGLLDERSDYGRGVFPEPFLVDDSDLEPGEGRLDWLHTAAGGSRSDVLTAEAEEAIGWATFELEVPYQWDTAPDGNVSGFDNIDVGARCPVFQLVSADGSVDATMGVAVEAGIPTGSALSKNAEAVPKIFNDLKIGKFTVQTVLGYSTLFGPGDDGGLQSFEYGFVFGYTIPHDALALPGIEQVIPVVELSGETALNKSDPGRNSLVGDAGLRFNLKAIGRIQPRPGIAFVFPLTSAARSDLHWGVATSLVFEF